MFVLLLLTTNFFVIFFQQITYILANKTLVSSGFVKSTILGFVEGSVIAVFAVEYVSSSSVTESDIYTVLNEEVETGTITDGVDYVTVQTTSLSTIESKFKF